MRDTVIGYTGQRRSGVSGHYLLGNGYRGFNPVLKQFAGQDSLSPFGAGGEHGFAYCGGNPVNQSDPSGHGPVVDLLVLSFFGAIRNTRRFEELELAGIITDSKAGERSGILALTNDGEKQIISYKAQVSLVEDEAIERASDFLLNYLRNAGLDVDKDASHNFFIDHNNMQQRLSLKPRFNHKGEFTGLNVKRGKNILLKGINSQTRQFISDYEKDSKYWFDKLKVNRTITRRPLPELPDKVDTEQSISFRNIDDDGYAIPKEVMQTRQIRRRAAIIDSVFLP